MNKMQLSNDPVYALSQIASYLRTMRIEPQRAVRDEGETVGYWQCTDWLNGLLEIADECDRIAITPVDSPALAKGADTALKE